MRRTLILFFTQLLLWALIAQVNHALSGYRVYLFTGALYLTFAALMQPLRAGLIATILMGFVCDAQAPINPELPSLLYSLAHTHTLLFVAAHLFIFHWRDRVPREDPVACVVVALIANLALFLAFSFLQILFSPAAASAWSRLIVDLLCSQLFLAVIAGWFFALQARALVLARVEPTQLA